MIHPDVDLLIATFVATAAIIILFFFLPALIELKKPGDAGPRLIEDDVPQIGITELKNVIIQNFTCPSTIEIAFCVSALLNIDG